MHSSTSLELIARRKRWLPRSAGWAALSILIVALAAPPADAQVLGGRGGGRLGARLAERLRPPPDEVVAVAGSPFGVGKITLQLPPDASGSAFDAPPLTLADAHHRVFYPATVDTPIRAAIREMLARPRPATVYFLFTGDEPLDLTLFGPSGATQHAEVQHDQQLHQQLLDAWWKQYTSDIRRPNRSNDYPHLPDAYLTSMLANRLSLAPIEFPRGLLAEKLPEMNQTLGLVLGTEDARLAVALDTMLHTSPDSLASEPLQNLPPPVAIEAAETPVDAGNVEIEPLATHVPEECLYIRFAGFPNYQWFRSTLDDWGGDLRNMISRRGVDYGLNPKLERQLSLKENALSQLLGPTVIADMALVGDDPFFREGAAIGMLFQARANVLLDNDIRRNRMDTMSANPDAKETHIDIAGHDVAFLSTPDNRVRSFYAVDGDFHLVTTSRQMVERFYEAGAGKRSLAQAADFRHARFNRKPTDDDSVFAYLSQAFFQQLASPHYQIEMTRRLRSTTDIGLVEMARLAARNEGKPAETIEQLIAGGYLPMGFSYPGRRPDGSQLVLGPAGQLTDSLRGAPGTFTPIPDVEVRHATGAEVAAYGRFAQSIENGGSGPVGPTMVAVQRVALPEPGRERVTLDIRMAPLTANADKFVRPALGPAGRQRIAPLPGDVVSLEISTSGRGLLSSLFPMAGAATPAHLFAGVRNSSTPTAAIQVPGISGLPQGLTSPQGLISQVLNGINTIEALRWYVGGWPSPGSLQAIGIGGPNVQQDAEGFGFGGGFWQRQIGSPAGTITVASQKRDVVAEVAGSLSVVEAEHPAQIWLHAGDISDSRVAALANQLGFMLERGISRGNEHLLHRLTTQLGVPPEQALDVAQNLLDARLVSPIGGRYELQNRAGEFPTWTLAGLPDGGRGGLLPAPPPDFQVPPLNWLRGIDAYGGSDATGLWVHAEVAMQRPGTTAESGDSARAKPQAGPPTGLAPPPPAPLSTTAPPTAAPPTAVPPPAVPPSAVPPQVAPPPLPSPPEPGPK